MSVTEKTTSRNTMNNNHPITRRRNWWKTGQAKAWLHKTFAIALPNGVQTKLPYDGPMLHAALAQPEPLPGVYQ